MSQLVDQIMDKFFDVFVPIMLIVFVICLVAMVVATIAQLFSKTINLKESEWECTSFVDVESTVYIQSGNVLVPHKTTNRECAQWSRKKDQ